MYQETQSRAAGRGPIAALLTQQPSMPPKTPIVQTAAPCLAAGQTLTEDNSMKDISPYQPPCATPLANLIKWKDYVLRYPNFWPTEHSARHFLNTRKAQLIALGILEKTTTGWMVDYKLLDEKLFDLLKHPDQEQLKLPLETQLEGGEE